VSVRRELFRQYGWSARTLSRFNTAMKLFRCCKDGDKKCRAALNAVTRPGGSINVTRLLEIALVTFAQGTSPPRAQRAPNRARGLPL
jgi:hypothetical protein